MPTELLSKQSSEILQVLNFYEKLNPAFYPQESPSCWKLIQLLCGCLTALQLLVISILHRWLRAGMFTTIKSCQLTRLLLHFFSPRHSQAFFTLLSQKVSPHILKELSFTAQSSHTPEPLGIFLGFVMFGKIKTIWMEPSQTSGYENDCIFKISPPKYLPFPKHANICLLSWKGSPPRALHSSFLHHCTSRGGEKKNPQHPTHFFGFSFFPF